MRPGEKLLSWRLAAGLSQREAAAKVNLSQAAWQSYESGHMPRVPAANAIEALTAGTVKASEWTETDEERAVRKARAAARRVRRPKAEADAPPPSDSGTLHAAQDDDGDHGRGAA